MGKVIWKNVIGYISFLLIICIGICSPKKSLADSVDTYKLGDNIVGVLSSDCTLVISGTGDMYDYGYNNESPLSKLHIKKVIVEDGVTSVGNSLFYENNWIEEVIIAGSVKTIGHDAFLWCSNLKYIKLQDGVEEIESWAFGRCSNLKKVEMADSIKTIEMGVFYGCFKLEDISMPSSLEILGENSLGACLLLESIYLPATVEKIDMGIMDSTFTMEKAIELSILIIIVMEVQM